MTRAEELLRQTIKDMAGEARAVDGLAQGAIATGRRMRLRRRLAVSGGALLAVAAVLVPVAVWKSGHPPITPAASPDVTTINERVLDERMPQELAGGWMVAGVGPWILDSDRNRYAELQIRPEQRVVPRPTGGLAAVITVEDRYVIDFVRPDGTTARTVTVRGGGGFQWSPDGRLLLAKLVGPSAAMGFAIIDPETGVAEEHWIDTGTYDCSMCEFVWMRDGREVAMAVADRRGGEAHEYVSSVQLFDARTGEPTRTLRMTAMFSSPYSWSPDGRYVICRPDAMKREYQLLDVTTGEATPFPADAVWVTGDVLLALSDPGGSGEGRNVHVVWRDGKPFRSFELGGAFRDQGLVTLGPPA